MYLNFHNSNCLTLNDTEGQGLREAFVECWKSDLFDDLLTSGAIPIDFVVAPLGGRTQLESLDEELLGADDARVIIGRRGSPIRATHLHYMLGYARRYGFSAAREIWTQFATHVLDRIFGERRIPAADVLVRPADALMIRAMILAVESRLYGLRPSYWGDNSDVFSRLFDTADTRSSFPLISCKRNGDYLRRSSPYELFLEIQPSIVDSLLDFSLMPLCTTFSTIDTVAIGLGSDVEHLRKRYTWPVLEALYRRAAHLSFARFLPKVVVAKRAISPDVAQLAGIGRAFAEQVPLVVRESVESDASIDVLTLTANELRVPREAMELSPRLSDLESMERCCSRIRRESKDAFQSAILSGKRSTICWTRGMLRDVASDADEGFSK